MYSNMCTSTRTHARTHAHMHAHTQTNTHTCTYGCTNAYMHIHTYAHNMYTSIYVNVVLFHCSIHGHIECIVYLHLSMMLYSLVAHQCTVTNAILAAVVTCANFTTRAVLHDCMYSCKIMLLRTYRIVSRHCSISILAFSKFYSCINLTCMPLGFFPIHYGFTIQQ